MKKISVSFLIIFNKLSAPKRFYKVMFSRSLTISPPSPLVPLQMLCIVSEVLHTDLIIGAPDEVLPEWKGHFAYLALDIVASVPLADICFHHCNVTRLTPAVNIVFLN